MATFLVERTLPGLTLELLAEAHRCLQEAVRRVSGSGEEVRYVRCTYLPEEQRMLCLFEAATADGVRRVNEIAQMPFRRIAPASEFPAPGLDEALPG